MTEILSREKREQILRATLREFAQNGYSQASTNNITEQAGVSKGLLFHYFGNKKKLFLHVLDLCLARFEEHLAAFFNNMPADIFERVLEISMAKLEFSLKEPEVHSLLTGALADPPAELQEEIAARRQRLYSVYMPMFTANVDTSNFRPEISPHKAMELIMLVLDALSEKHVKIYRETGQSGGLDLSSALAEAKVYLEMLKYGVYRRQQ